MCYIKGYRKTFLSFYSDAKMGKKECALTGIKVSNDTPNIGLYSKQATVVTELVLNMIHY